MALSVNSEGLWTATSMIPTGHISAEHGASRMLALGRLIAKDLPEAEVYNNLAVVVHGSSTAPSPDGATTEGQHE